MPNITRGSRTAGLLNYLLGPGRENEHAEPHMVAGSPHLMALHGDAELARSDAGSIARELDAPMAAFGTTVEAPLYRFDPETNTRVKIGYGDAHVWHCSLSLKAEEGQLDDETWGRIASDFVDAMGFGDEEGSKAPCRWVAVRHGLSKNGNDHVHIVVNLAREDGTKASTWKDFATAQRAAGELERKYGLQILESREHDYAARGISPAEQRRMAARGAVEPERTTLHRRVRAAAMAAGDEAEFVRRVRRAGVLIRPRFASGRDDVVTGYSVALRAQAGEKAVWFGGGQLARDLALPRLRAYWPDTPQHAGEAVGEWRAAWRGQRPVATTVDGPPTAVELREHTAKLRALREQLRTVDPADTATWSHVARQCAGVLSAWSVATEPTPGPLAAAASDLSRFASTRTAPVRSKTPARSATRGLALTISALDPRTPDVMRAAIVVRQLIMTLAALHGAYMASQQHAAAAGVDHVVRTHLATLDARLQAAASAGAGTTLAPARTAPVVQEVAPSTSTAPSTPDQAPTSGGTSSPATAADALERLRVTDPDAWRAEVLRRKVFGSMGSPVPARTTPTPTSTPARATKPALHRDDVDRDR